MAFIRRLLTWLSVPGERGAPLVVAAERQDRRRSPPHRGERG